MMTVNEAIIRAQKERDMAVYQSETSLYPGIVAINQDRAEWLSQLIWAANRVVPKKPEITSTKATVCPCCDRFIDRHEQSHGNLDIPHCKWCGQAINWN